ncbi:MAG: hypothetical protein K0R73_522 [Candidatus Midichloriaceae bacterium]|jgi:hypothetical protein|nr:hypothetical protein [Candidatus Midichloriaceae bacterium]
MASIVLSSVGAAAGSVIGGAIGSAAGQLIGATAGRFIDNKLFGNSLNGHSSGPRLKDLSIQTASYGVTIPILFGVIRTAGNIIWARPLKEKATNIVRKAGGKGARIRHTHTEYSYFASFAISICEGEIDEILRIYAGNEQINLSSYTIRIYKGSESQMPDPLIESFEGAGKTPAFRGQAYVVFEDLPLAEFGNQIPNFNFEVRKRVSSQAEDTPDKLIKSIVMIPGGGEYVYDTVTQFKSIGSFAKNKWCQLGKSISLNHNTNSGKTNAMLALDQLKSGLPNVEWVSVVVNWFGTSLDIKDCQVLPGVEYNDSSTQNSPDTWSVAGFSRQNAHQISLTNNRPNYGGTINDSSIIRFIEELKSRGYKVALYPMIFMDLPNKPWRGELAGSPEDVEAFFARYNKFITHYCGLLHGKIDALIIGSEFKKLTSIQSTTNLFPAVHELVKLAKICKSIVGSQTILTYAADWSEYHHAPGGWYHMDPLWSSPDLDVIGIDAYFPLSNSRNSIYDINAIKHGWESGEGYDFYYEDEKCTIPKPLAAPYAWKNLRWWWENEHINPDGTKTCWVPKSKKIWFTEYGFPSIDCCTNEPNVFYDPCAAVANYPRHSQGTIDFKAQMSAIIATELQWQNSDMIENKFLWCWDARPYPYWPDLCRIWSDGGSWQKGHWVQGKIGNSTLAGVLEELAAKAGICKDMTSCSIIHESMAGLILDSQTSIKNIIQILQKAYQFDTVEKNGKVHFCHSTIHNAVDISYQDLAKVSNLPTISITRTQEMEMPYKVDVNYMDINTNYRISNRHAQHINTVSKQVFCLDLPLALDQDGAKLIAENCIHNFWISRNKYSFFLPPKYLDLTPGDIINIRYKNQIHCIKAISVKIGKNNLVKVDGVSYKESQRLLDTSNSSPQALSEFIPISETDLIILDIPYLPKFNLDESYILMGAITKTDNWTGATVFTSGISGSAYEELTYLDALATTGCTLTKLPHHTSALIDYESKVIINLQHGELCSVSPYNISCGANLCLIGDELIQFQNAKLIGENQYKISTLYRGLYSTNDKLGTHDEGDRFILIDDALKKVNIPSNSPKHMYIKAITNGLTLGSATEIEFNYQSNCLRNFAPASIWLCENQLSWIRQNRIHTNLLDYTDIPLEERQEQYLVKLIFDVGTKVLKTSEPNIMLNDEDIKVIKSIQICQLNNLGLEGFYSYFTK